MLAALTAGATLGLVNLAHCAAMCGPLSSTMSHPARKSGLLRYQVGRLMSYAFMGALSGHLGRALQLIAPNAATVWIVAALSAGACLLTARSLLTPASAQAFITLRVVRPRRSVFSIFVALVPKEPVVLGALSALLPCGVLASALLVAVASGDAVSGSAMMFAFAAVSGVAVWTAGFATQLVPRRFGHGFRRMLAYTLVALAALTVYRPIYALTHAPQTAARSVTCH